MGSVIVLVVLVVLFVLWRRRPSRRQAAAQERVAGVLAPEPPPGRYPRPVAGAHRLNLPGVTVHRMCHDCGRVTPSMPGPVTESRWLVVDLCRACVADRWTEVAI